MSKNDEDEEPCEVCEIVHEGKCRPQDVVAAVERQWKEDKQ